MAGFTGYGTDMIIHDLSLMGFFGVAIQAGHVICSACHGTVTCPQDLVIFAGVAIGAGKTKLSHMIVEGRGRIGHGL